MGGMCCKPSAIEDSKESPRERLSSKAVSDLRVSRGTSSRREEVFRVKDRYDNNEGRTTLIDKQGNGSARVQGDSIERKREKMEYAVAPHPGIGSVPKAMEGEQVAAGWRRWKEAEGEGGEDSFVIVFITFTSRGDNRFNSEVSA
ncbi:uncharacterized protein LOC124843816 [Vigna umbellata]|uniref:uncharacterized protein LOC124843816 n=1 Tax=Vigna umbellata TaxID=87088 RepID=UPI001F5E56EB|nr:uncharacterized protein LOC124843816 [Vigna umbellata]